MMKEKRLKYIFLVSSSLLLIVMLIISRNAGTTCDDVLHFHHSETVYNYFASHGTDQSALHTPVSNLKYYGQSYDNIVTIIIKWLRIEDVYSFRHLMSTLAGWLTIFIAALFAVWLSGYRTGILVIFLFAVSPTFMGHSLNNLKDIPFALGYISSIFFTLKILFSDKKVLFLDYLPLILCISFSISVRAGGLLLICYLFLFFIISLAGRYYTDGRIDLNESYRKLIILIMVAGASFFLGILLWPFALQSPFKNVLESYHVMTHFPSTFRQIFEGKAEWSDFMPWYFLPKSMIITIPFTVLAGFLLFILFFKRTITHGKTLLWIILLFTVLFPIIFVIIGKSNIYSSWRQFLFLYPPIVIFAASGFSFLIDYFKNRNIKWIVFAIILILSIHPIRFMAGNKPYFYLYYNQLVGGLKGAYGNYETDYYNTSQTEASEWLINYLEKNSIDSAIVQSTFAADWEFRNKPSIRTSYFRNEERSQYDWDYAIIVNRYIPPFMLKNKSWPPKNTIHIIYADSVPICAVLERRTKADYYGYKALEEGRSSDAIYYFNEALRFEDNDELFFYNFARALNNEGEFIKADSALQKGLKINPECEPILMYLGNIASVRNDTVNAIKYYENLLSVNPKYFEAYVELSKLEKGKDMEKARRMLRTCLDINPRFRPAVVTLADTYRKSNPGIAEKYDIFANSLK